MYVKTKQLTISAACLALSMIIILVESVLGFSTLFLLGFAGFMIGVVIREGGIKFGTAYFLASLFLSFAIAPDKLKLPVFLGIEAYLLFREAFWEWLEKDKKRSLPQVKRIYFLAKFLSFNLMLIPIVFLLPELIMPAMDMKWKIITIVVSQPVWYIVDRAYDYFQIAIWDRIKHKK